MKIILEDLYQHKTLSAQAAGNILMDMASGKYNPNQIASFLTALIMRKITIEELKGFRAALLELCLPVDLKSYNPIDLCGTGGDGKNTFNISTLASFVVAGAGIPVAKHGNYGVSSISGSSNVLEYLGLVFHTNNEVLKNQMDYAGICFLHAPLFHPSLKQVASVRKELGVKTFFNMLGPLVNPAQPCKQVVGVFSLELARHYQYIFQELELDYTILHALDGFDEISLTADCKMISNNEDQIVSPDYFNLPHCNYEDLYGGDTIKQAATIFTAILNGKGKASQNNVVIANAAIAIKTYHPTKQINECLELARDSLFNLKALHSFTLLKQLS